MPSIILTPRAQQQIHAGQRARHMFLYRIRDDVEIARFLYDGMDLSRYWPDDWRSAE